LVKARQRRTEVRQQLTDGIDPGDQKKAARQAQKTEGLTFETLAREWYAYNAPRWADATAYKAKLYLDIVPLPRQAVAILRQLHEITGRYALVFAGANPERPMSENTINKALRLAGYEGRQTGHGFRHLLSTELNGRGYNKDWIERQLAHGDSDEIRGTYNFPPPQNPCFAIAPAGPPHTEQSARARTWGEPRGRSERARFTCRKSPGLKPCSAVICQICVNCLNRVAAHLSG
jgi:hypothetical protein